MRRGRKSKREEIKDLNAAFRYLGMSSGKEELAETLCRPEPKRRAPRQPSGVPLEADILRDILLALRKHPKVARVERRQSGVFRDGDRWVRVGNKGQPDISGILHGGRAFQIEVKRPGKFPDDNQWRQINAIRAAGGIAGCAHSVAEALAIVDEDPSPL